MSKISKLIKLNKATKQTLLNHKRKLDDLTWQNFIMDLRTEGLKQKTNN